MVSTIIKAVGIYNPEQILTNADLERRLDTSDAWILQRTGIKERRIARADEDINTMAYAAVENLIQRIQSLDGPIDHVLFTSNTITEPVPNSAMRLIAQVQRNHPGLIHPYAMGSDITAACAGINVAVMYADAFIKTEQCRRVLVIGSEKMSSVTDYSQKETAVLFGDGATAYLLEKCYEQTRGYQQHYIQGNAESLGHITFTKKQRLTFEEFMRCTSREQIANAPRMNGHTIGMNGREVFKYVVTELTTLMRNMPDIFTNSDGDNSYKQFAAIVCHQANDRMIEAVDKNIPGFKDRCISTVGCYGNTSTASQGRPCQIYFDNGAKKGDVILQVGFGAGLTLCANIYRV